jgi:hypothetical protein
MKRLLVVVALLQAVAASTTYAATAPTLTGESFHQDRAAITWADCRTEITFGYRATGTATGPYPGTFVETGTVGFPLHATFTIDSPVGKVTGTKVADIGRSCVTDYVCNGLAECANSAVGYNTNPSGFADSDTYEATIKTPSGDFSDHGLWGAALYHTSKGDQSYDGFNASFQSALQSPVKLFPTTLSDCRNGGWQNFGTFENQGDCIRAVLHRARQACTFERAAHGVRAFRAKYGVGQRHVFAMRHCVEIWAVLGSNQ